VPHQKSDPFDKVALQLGHISIQWGRLERDLSEFIELLTPLDLSQTQINEAITGNIDVRGKIQIIKALAFLRKDDDEWFNIMLNIMNKIDNDIRVRRNSYIHAGWYTPKGRMHRYTYKTKLFKPQSFSLVLETKQVAPVPISELRTLRRELDDLVFDLMVLLWYMIPPTAKEKAQLELMFPSGPPKITFRQYLRGVGYGRSGVRRLRAYAKRGR
jgi:hypothetical protein